MPKKKAQHLPTCFAKDGFKPPQTTPKSAMSIEIRDSRWLEEVLHEIESSTQHLYIYIQSFVFI